MATLIRSPGRVLKELPSAEAETMAGAIAAEDFRNLRREIVIVVISLSWNPKQGVCHRQQTNRRDRNMQSVRIAIPTADPKT